MEFERHYAKDFFVKKSSALPKNFKKRKTKYRGKAKQLRVILSGAKYHGVVFGAVEPPLRVVPRRGRISKKKDSAYLPWRSRLTAPSLWSGSTSPTTHWVVGSAQDDTELFAPPPPNLSGC